MRRAACVFLLLLVTARPAAAYVGWRLGAFTPSGEDLLQSSEFETGPLIGYSFRPWLAAELGISYFPATGAHEVIALGVPTHPELMVFPITLSVVLEQVIARPALGRVGIYGLGGPGAFLTTYVTPLEDSLEKLTLGYHFGLGVHVGPFGVEGRRVSTQPTFEGNPITIEGLSVALYWAGGR